MEIYLAGTGRGPKKIGIGTSAAKRVRAIQNASGKAMSLHHSERVPVGAARAIESHAHWMLADRWVRGEWFDVSVAEAKEVIAESIKAVAEGRAQRGNRNLGRPKINDEQTPGRFRAGTLARIDAVLVEKEKRSDFIREAVERELDRREKKR